MMVYYLYFSGYFETLYFMKQWKLIWKVTLQCYLLVLWFDWQAETQAYTVQWPCNPDLDCGLSPTSPLTMRTLASHHPHGSLSLALEYTWQQTHTHTLTICHINILQNKELIIYIKKNIYFAFTWAHYHTLSSLICCCNLMKTNTAVYCHSFCIFKKNMMNTKIKEK